MLRMDTGETLWRLWCLEEDCRLIAGTIRNDGAEWARPNLQILEQDLKKLREAIDKMEAGA
jgi:hypothetical protein